MFDYARCFTLERSTSFPVIWVFMGMKRGSSMSCISWMTDCLPIIFLCTWMVVRVGELMEE